jgi:hypothetical protein
LAAGALVSSPARYCHHAGATSAFQHAKGAADRGQWQAELGGQLSGHGRTHLYQQSGDELHLGSQRVVGRPGPPKPCIIRSC